MREYDYRERLDAALLDDDAAPALWQLVTEPATDELFPELAALNMDHRGRHKDVLDHTIKVVVKMPARLRIRLAALCHDLGKPATREFHSDGTVSFHQHEAVGAAMVRKRLKALGYDRELIDEVATLVDMSGRFKDCDGWSDSAVRRFVTDAGEVLEDLLVFSALDVTSKHDHKHVAQAEQIVRLRARIAEVEAADARRAERPELSGAEVMMELGVRPGPLVGEALKLLLDAQRRNGGPLGRDRELELLHEWWQSRAA